MTWLDTFLGYLLKVCSVVVIVIGIVLAIVLLFDGIPFDSLIVFGLCAGIGYWLWKAGTKMIRGDEDIGEYHVKNNP